jgi:Flp pilus assembly protein CpaB
MTVSSARPRVSGGWPLIILGIVLALATAILVLFLTNSTTSGSRNGIDIIVAARQLDAGAIISSEDDSSPNISINQALKVQRIPEDVIPSGAYHFTTQNDLIKDFKDLVVVDRILEGDVLRKDDPRLIAKGTTTSSKSLANLKPGLFPSGSVLFSLHVSDSNGLQDGDRVDILATACSGSTATNSTSTGGCQLTQTTLQNILIYHVLNPNTLIVVVSHQDALVLKSLIEIARLDYVLRKPGDDTAVTTHAIDPAWIASHFGFAP